MRIEAWKWHSMRRFPWLELVLMIVVGIPALMIAMLCGWQLASFSGPQYDIVIFNDHVWGGAADKVTALGVGSLSGAVAVFCGLRAWSRYVEWQRP